MSRLIEPRILRGFRDYPPERMIPREELLEKARKVYRSYGFAPIDTPALEYTEVLLAKVEPGAEIGKQLYRFRDNGDRDVCLRFDLTVPLARFVAEHHATLGLPFRRYHLGTVWRGETPTAGRFREFMQCDFDILGTTSNAADVEIALVINDLLAALGFDRFEIRVNNRMVLNGLLAGLGLEEKSVSILRSLDKLPKVGREEVVREMASAEIDLQKAEEVISLASMRGTNTEILAELSRRFVNNPSALRGVSCLQEMVQVAEKSGVPEKRLRVDLSICRGLDYYTGSVYETFLLDNEKIGSICSGGRYDNLTGSYLKQAIPGVGASLGLDRLLAAMEEMELLPKAATTAPVLVLLFDMARLGDYQRIARHLRAAGIAVEVYPEAKKLGSQFQYAERRGVRIGLIAGGDEFAKGVWKVKDLVKREEKTVPESDLVAAINEILGTKIFNHE